MRLNALLAWAGGIAYSRICRQRKLEIVLSAPVQGEAGGRRKIFTRKIIVSSLFTLEV
jgi:hypothetical protein